MSKTITLRKGLDVRLEGEAQKSIVDAPMAEHYAISPTDFQGVTPKLLVKVGDSVKAGGALFFSKADERILFTSPVSGTVAEIVRGDKRKILSIIVSPETTQSYEEFSKLDLTKAKRTEVVEHLLKSGLWATIIQRPYGIIASPDNTPKAIFISAFDTAPLAPDYEFALKDSIQDIQTGINALRKLTDGAVHLSMSHNSQVKFASLSGVTSHAFKGKHPAGNVGVQIHHIDPINKGEVAWTVNIADVAMIGRLFSEGRVDMRKVVAVTGSELEQPQYVRAISGATISSLTKGNVKAQKEGDTVRYISGNALTGVKVAKEGYITFYANQLTLLPEGDKYAMLGWIMPRFDKFSVSTTFFSWLCPKKRYALDTNLNGGERPFIVTGLYEKYLPMDLYPVYLIKACLAQDIDKMEALGIYEVTEEDLALCEFVDPSKIEFQKILRDGINLMIKEA